jgi:fructoselysine-6-P-deglycase FrlB-like protein
MPTSDSPLQKSHGPFYAVAREAGLKVTEMSCSYGQTCHPLEFRHGRKAIAGRRLRDLVRELGATAPEISPLAPFMVPAELLRFHTGTRKGFDPDDPRHLTRIVILD